MAWQFNKTSQFNRAGYSNNAYQGSNYQFKKDSVKRKNPYGVKTGFTKEKNTPFIFAWRYLFRSKKLISLNAVELNKTHTAKNSKIVYKVYLCKVKDVNAFQETTYWGYYNADRKLLYIPKLKMMVSVSRRWFGFISK